MLVKPVTEAGCRSVRVYLPAGADWTNAWTGRRYPGGQTVTVDAPLDQIPLFTKNQFVLNV